MAGDVVWGADDGATAGRADDWGWWGGGDWGAGRQWFLFLLGWLLGCLACFARFLIAAYPFLAVGLLEGGYGLGGLTECAFELGLAVGCHGLSPCVGLKFYPRRPILQGDLSLLYLFSVVK